MRTLIAFCLMGVMCGTSAGQPSTQGAWEPGQALRPNQFPTYCPGPWTGADAIGVHSVVVPKTSSVLCVDESVEPGNYPSADIVVVDPTTTPATVTLVYDNNLCGGGSFFNTHQMFCGSHVADTLGRIVWMSGGLICGPFGGDSINGKTAVYVHGDPNPLKIGREEKWCLTPGCAPGTETTHRRYYPTATVLANGNILKMAGTCGPSPEYGNRFVPAVVRVKTALNAWTFNPLYAAELGQPDNPPDLVWYPFMFQTSDAAGTVVMAGHQPGYTLKSRKLDRAQGIWLPESEFSPEAPIGGASAVMYRRDVIMKAGGVEQSPDARAFKLDLTVANPQWVPLPNMHQARDYMYLIALPDGQILAIGGPVGTQPETYDPYSNTWKQLAASPATRDHHFSAVLLPDGSVWVTGGDNGPRDFQIFKPPYFFTTFNQRPAIANCPDVIYYGDSFDVDLVGATNVTAVRLIRSGAATHNFDQNQRCMELNFTVVDSDTIKVSSPATGFQAPPGYYMLFV